MLDRRGAILPWVTVAALASHFLTGIRDVSAQSPPPGPAGRSFSGRTRYSNPIDEMVFARLKELGIPPSKRCPDHVFLRRAYLDVTGTLPTEREVRAFLSEKKPDKRSVLIDRLLERDEFADYRAMKWCDLLRVKAEFPSNLWPNAVQAYYRWIRTSLRNNVPYDRFARELLTSSGSNFRVPPVNFYRAIPQKNPHKIAEAVALTFMGVRTKNWTEDRRLGMAAFFAKVGYKSTGEWKEEIVYFDPNGKLLNPATGEQQPTVLPSGERVSLRPDVDPREEFADWLISRDNPFFARCIVNRTWYRLMGRGIIHEPDDIRPDNPPQNPELLRYLEKELIDHLFDLKHIYRLILNSRTYQLSAEHTPENISDQTNFSHYYVRRLEAEVLIDAICQITGTTESYSSRVPEPFTFVPEYQRSICLADGSITSPFLEKFGRPPRDTGLESERDNEPSAAQRLHLLNSTHIQQKLSRSGRIRRLAGRNRRSDVGIIKTLYITILSRFPTADELKIARAYMQSGKYSRPDRIVDLGWALINSKEFMFRH